LSPKKKKNKIIKPEKKNKQKITARETSKKNKTKRKVKDISVKIIFLPVITALFQELHLCF